METYENKVKLQGKIIRKISNGEIGSLVVEATISKDGTKRNRPRVMFFNEMAKELDQYEKDDFVYIEGNIQPYKIKNLEGKEITSQSVVATLITKAKSRMELKYGVKGNNLYDKIDEVELAGVVTYVSEPDDQDSLKYITVRTVKNGRTSVVRTKAFVKPFNKDVLNSLEKGDNVCVMGTIQTRPKKSESGKIIFFENVIAMEISKLDA